MTLAGQGKQQSTALARHFTELNKIATEAKNVCCLRLKTANATERLSVVTGFVVYASFEASNLIFSAMHIAVPEQGQGGSS